MLKKLNEYIRKNNEHVIRITWGATFVFRSVLQAVPWILIEDINGYFVAFGDNSDLVFCFLGLFFILFFWKTTYLRMFIVWLLASFVALKIFYFYFIAGKYSDFRTTSFYILSFLTSFTWAFGTGIFLGKQLNWLLENKKIIFIKTNVLKENRRKKRNKRKKRK